MAEELFPGLRRVLVEVTEEFADFESGGTELPDLPGTPDDPSFPAPVQPGR